MNFTFNLTLYDKGKCLPDLCSHKTTIFDFSFSSQKVYRLIKSLDTRNVTGLDNFSEVVKNSNPELSLVLAKLFTFCLKEKYFSSYGRCWLYTLFSGMWVSACHHCNIVLSASWVSSANALSLLLIMFITSPETIIWVTNLMDFQS